MAWRRGRAFVRSYWTPAGKRALGNLIGLVVCTGISQGCALGVLLLLTYGLTQEGFGAVIFALALQGYLVNLGTLGLHGVVIRDLTRDPDAADAITNAYLWTIAGASVCAAVLTIAVAAVASIPLDERLLIAVIAVGNVAACLNLSPLFDAAHRQALAAALMLPGDLIALAVVAALDATGGLTVPAVGVVMAGKWVLTAALHAVVYRRTVRPWRVTWDRDLALRMARSGRPLMVAALLNMIPQNGGVLAARLWLGDADTAVYGVASQLAAVCQFVAILLVRILQPHIAGRHGLEREFLWKLALFLGLSLAALWVGFVTAAWLTVRWLPPAYEPAFPLAVLLISAAVSIAVAAVFTAYLVRQHDEVFVQWANAGGAALTVVGLALTPWIGLTVIAVVTLAAATVLTLGLAVRAGFGRASETLPI